MSSISNTATYCCNSNNSEPFRAVLLVSWEKNLETLQKYSADQLFFHAKHKFVTLITKYCSNTNNDSRWWDELLSQSTKFYDICNNKSNIIFGVFFSTGSFNVIVASSNKIVIHEKMHSADILPTSTHFALETQSVYLGGKTPFSQMVLGLLLLNSP